MKPTRTALAVLKSQYLHLHVMIISFCSSVGFLSLSLLDIQLYFTNKYVFISMVNFSLTRDRQDVQDCLLQICQENKEILKKKHKQDQTHSRKITKVKQRATLCHNSKRNKCLDYP